MGSLNRMKISHKKLTQADLFLIVANLLPVYGVWFLNWNAWEVFAVYTLETIIVGVINIFKMGIVAAVKKKDVWENNGIKTMVSGLFFILFFILHYGLFCFVQMSLFFGFSPMRGEHVDVWQFLTHINQYLSSDAWLMLSVFIAGYGFKTISEFIISGRYQVAPLMVVMFEPYGRIFIQQLTVIIGAFFLLFGAAKIFVLIFTGVKIYFSIFVNFDGLITREMNKRITQQSNSSHS